MVDQPLKDQSDQNDQPEVIFHPDQTVQPHESTMPAKQRHLLFVIILLAAMVIGSGIYYFASSRQNNASLENLPAEDLHLNEDIDCTAIGNEVDDVPEECKNGGDKQKGCGGEGQPKCPAEATLGENITKSPIEWPVSARNWPTKAAKPIANCDLLYSKDNNTTISVGFEVNVPEQTPVVVGATGKVAYIKDGNVVIETTLKNSKDNILYLAYGYLKPESLTKLTKGSPVAKGDVLGMSGSGLAGKAELKQSVQFGIWTDANNFEEDGTKLNTEQGKALLKKLQHPMNYLTLDGRKVSNCKNSRPYKLPVSNPELEAPTPGNGATVSFPLKVGKADIKNKSIFNNGTTSKGGHPYTAYDIYVDAGTPVLSMTKGTVNKLSSDRCGGRIVGIYNSDLNQRYSYMHLNPNSVTVKVGQKVSAGTAIGKVGATKAYSCNTVDHLHIDAVKGKVRVSCSRLGCTANNKALFVNLGPELFTTYQKL